MIYVCISTITFVNKHPDYNVIVLDKLTYAGNMDNLKKVMDKNRQEVRIVNEGNQRQI